MDEEKKILNIVPPKWGLWLATVAVAFLALFLAVLTWNQIKQHDYIGRSEQQIYTITIQGEGKITAIPDIAQVSLGIETQKNKVLDAQQENTTKMNELIASIKKLGVDDKDIKTANYSIYPRYNYNDGRQTLIGYTVSQSVSVKIRDLQKVGDVLGLAGNNGVNQLGGLNFTIDEPETIRQQAREKALQNAREKAESLAKVAGVKLGKLVSFSESGNNPVPMAYYDSYAMGVGGAAEKSVAPDIQPGSQDVTVDVNVTYEVL